MNKKVLLIFGTRPEAIKMAPIVIALKKEHGVDVKVCVTAQHREMLDQVLKAFDINPDYDLNIMAKNQSLADITSAILAKMPLILNAFKPDLVLVHGDTTTTFAAALSAFYAGVDVGHVEAGLRTGNIKSPWPEEANRHLVSVITKLHFAPTEISKQNLLNEGIYEDDIFVTGNTVVDALLYAKEKVAVGSELRAIYDEKYSFINSAKRMILVTGHRRESFGSGFEEICHALLALSLKYPDVIIVYPVHLNPMVRNPVNRILKGIAGIHLIEPLDYLPFVYFMEKSTLILTDSGGIQEEAPSLGKPVVVMRDVSERPEAVEAGVVKLAGANKISIVNEVSKILERPPTQTIKNPYGDGNSSNNIVKIIRRYFK